MALVVVTLIWLMALNRFHELQEQGEKTAVEMTISNINSGLQWEMADRIMTWRDASISEMAGSNPVRWLEKKPEGYLGEFPEIPDNFPSGSWYFDTKRLELRYRPILKRNLECPKCARLGSEIILSWRIARSGNPMYGRSDRVKIVLLANYKWF